MNSQKFCGLFNQYRIAVQNMQKTLTANSYLRISKGTRKVTRHRKYRRPQDIADPFYDGIGPKQEVKAAFQSISDRGFAKEQPSYDPPEDVDEQLETICRKIYGPLSSNEFKDLVFSDPLLKFKVLSKCVDTFKKDIPNSYLHKIKSIRELSDLYKTPVDGCLHYDALVRDSDKLPPNVNVMSETAAFNPATDTFLDGVTAYPHRKRIIYTKTGEKFEKTVEWPNL